METLGGERINVDSTPVDEHGNKLEPEERIAIETLPMPVEVTHADHAVRPGSGPAFGEMRSIVGIESTAGDVAMSTATRCELCAHWRHDDWTRHLSSIEGTRDGQRTIEMLRGELLGRAIDSGALDDEGIDIDSHDVAAVDLTIRREFGICAVFTETCGDVVASPFYGGCPADDVRFKTRDREAQAIASKGYDTILRLAQGKRDS